MARYWSHEYRSLPATGGERNCLELRFPQLCRITRLTIKQTGGVPVPIQARFYNSAFACARGESSSFGTDPEGDYQDSPEIHQVGHTMLSERDGFLNENWETGIPYENRDGEGTPMTRKDAIYIDINPGGGDLVTYDVGVTCEMED